MHPVFENGERFDTRERLVRAVAEVLRRSSHCRVEADRAERLAPLDRPSAIQPLRRRIAAR